MNTFYFYPFLILTVLGIAAMLLLPFWFKARLETYLKKSDPYNVYAAIIAVFGTVLGLIALSGWAVSILGLLQTTAEFKPEANSLHDWSFSLYGYLYSLRWSLSVAALMLFATSLYFWLAGRKIQSSR